jgi:PTS system mannose-specific IIB component
MDIQLFRIDDRLIHGQVVIGWANYLNSKKILLCDDSVSLNDWEKELYISIVPEGITPFVLNVNDTTAFLNDQTNDLARTIIVVNSPLVIESLWNCGIKPELVNVGGIHYTKGRRNFLPYLYLNETEIEAFKRCIEKGIKFECQDMPNSKKIQLADILQKN